MKLFATSMQLALVLTTPQHAKSQDNRTESAAGTKLTILHINDHHSHLSEDSAGYINIYGDDVPLDVANNNGNTTYVRAYFGGYPRLVTAFEELENDAVEQGREVLKLHAGDAITGTTFFTLFKGDADAKMMSHVCFDTFTPGNHEFDDGDAGLARFLKALETEHASSTCEKMPTLLGANIVPHANSALLAADVPQIRNNTLFFNGEVGVIGVDTMRKTMYMSSPDEGTILLDEKETVKAQVEELTALGVKKIIVVTHIGYNNDVEWIASLEGVDVVVGGDSHTLLGDDQTKQFADFTPLGSYATISEKADGTKTCVVQAWEYSKMIGNLEVDFDEAGDVISCEGSPVFPLNPDKVTVRDADPRYDLSAADAATVIASLRERFGGQARPFAEDSDAAKDLEFYAMQVEEKMMVTIAVASEFIALETLAKESGAGDLAAQGFLLYPLSTADIAIQNQGGTRGSILEGNFTINDAYNILPFSNTMVNIEMTGEQIENVLEDAVQYYMDSSGSWGAYPRAAGLRFGVDESKPKGSRISNLEVNPKLNGNWGSLDMSASYVVVANSFIAQGKDGYNEFGNIDDSLKVDTYVEYAQSFIDYAVSVKTLEKVGAERASTRTWVGVSNEDVDPLDNPDDAVDPVDDLAPPGSPPEDEKDAEGNSAARLRCMGLMPVVALAAMNLV